MMQQRQSVEVKKEVKDEKKEAQSSPDEIAPLFSPIFLNEKDHPLCARGISGINRMKVIGDKFLVLLGDRLDFRPSFLPDRYECAAYVFSLKDGQKIATISESDNGWRFWKRHDLYIMDILYHTTTKKLILAGSSREGEGFRVYDKSPLDNDVLSKSACPLKYQSPDLEYMDFLNEKFIIVTTYDGGISVLNVYDNFSEVDHIRVNPMYCFAVSHKSKWMAVSQWFKGPAIHIYKYNDETGKLTFCKSWKQIEQVTKLAVLEDGFLASTHYHHYIRGDNPLGPIVHVWDVDSDSNTSKIPKKYELADRKSSRPITRLLALPNDLLCVAHSNPMVTLWDLRSKTEITYFLNTVEVQFYRNHLILFKLEGPKWQGVIKFVDISAYLGIARLSHISSSTVDEYFIHGLEGVLRCYFHAVHSISSGLLERNVKLTLEELEEERYKSRAEAAETAFKLLSTSLLIINFMMPFAVSVGIPILNGIMGLAKEASSKSKDLTDDLHVKDAVSLLGGHMDTVVQLKCWLQGQHSLSSDILIKNLSDSFTPKDLEEFLDYAKQYFVWRYQNQIRFFSKPEAQKLGEALGERISEPFMIGLCPWDEKLSPKDKVLRVSNWVYYAGDLPFLMKRTKPSPTFQLAERDEKVQLNDILCPTGFEVLRSDGRSSFHIQVDPLERALNHHHLAAHRGGGEGMSPPSPPASFKSYCLATEEEVDQLNHQSAEVKKHPDKELNLLSRVTFFSERYSLPFLITPESAREMKEAVKPKPFEFKESGVKRDIVELQEKIKEKDRLFAVLTEENRELEKKAKESSEKIERSSEEIRILKEKDQKSSEAIRVLEEKDQKSSEAIRTMERRLAALEARIAPLPSVSSNPFTTFQPAAELSSSPIAAPSSDSPSPSGEKRNGF